MRSYKQNQKRSGFIERYKMAVESITLRKNIWVEKYNQKLITSVELELELEKLNEEMKFANTVYELKMGSGIRFKTGGGKNEV